MIRLRALQSVRKQTSLACSLHADLIRKALKPYDAHKWEALFVQSWHCYVLKVHSLKCFLEFSVVFVHQTNLQFSQWITVMDNERLIGAMVDRLTHKVHIIEANGESCRLRKSKQLVSVKVKVML